MIKIMDKDKCDHEYVFLMGKSVPSGRYTTTYERVHWCWKCGKDSCW